MSWILLYKNGVPVEAISSIEFNEPPALPEIKAEDLIVPELDARQAAKIGDFGGRPSWFRPDLLAIANRKPKGPLTNEEIAKLREHFLKEWPEVARWLEKK